ncbi:Pyruvate decarboxylase [Exophiala dermatitidis]|uniref:Pyruvate decarboxylase n=1 Tax=Exophiala dermatitidis (strain ATCC 34100 / CBS 525.76 / NIH/UT8656) TaxID=858893 RepID=H6C7K9_EXODN|nr:pyruvate decarboxylase [Exophiala dermatitidis NIH/UT8656]EHY58839.1 pyruvate decarboxylase [Exophiala dermatitidis NIH/UT8656]
MRCMSVPSMTFSRHTLRSCATSSDRMTGAPRKPFITSIKRQHQQPWHSICPNVTIIMSWTVGSYLAERLSQIGIEHHFVVPGDYNLVLLDQLQAHPKLSEIGCANELNCSFAAEGYARAKGVAAAVVTFSVGAFSAFNGLGGAYAENLPVILISGSPNTNDAGAFHLLHHTLGTHDFEYQRQIAEKITCAAVAVRRAQDAPRLIDHAIRSALLAKKPSYIEIPTNLSNVTCPAPGPISAVIAPEPSDEPTLAAAVHAATNWLKAKQKPILLAGPKLRAAGGEAGFLQLAEAIGCAVAVMPGAKSFFPEDHKQFVGVYWGQASTMGADAIVDWADGIFGAGLVFTDYSTVGWTAIPSESITLNADLDNMSFPGATFNRVRLADLLSALAKEATPNPSTMVEYARLRPDILPPHHEQPKLPLHRVEIARQIQELLHPKTTLFAETGDSWFNAMQMNLPRDCRFEIEMQWGHIGWSVPASFGYAVGAPERQVLLMIGDGSFQMTAQEVSQMVRSKVPIIIFLMNNGGYTIEVEIHDGLYNRIKNWNYAAMMEVFNAGDGHAKGIKASNPEQLAQAIKLAKSNSEGPTLIECIIDQDDCTKELITWGHYVATANGRPPAHT